MLPCHLVSFLIDTIPNRNSPPAILLREAGREGKRVRRRTLANLTHVPPALVEGMRTLLKGGVVMDRPGDMVSIVRALPHGHVQAVLGMCRQLGLERILHRQSSWERGLALPLIVSRVIQPASKLATARALSPDSNSPYSFNLDLVSVFPCFGTGNRRFQAFHTAFRRALRRVPSTDISSIIAKPNPESPDYIAEFGLYGELLVAGDCRFQSG